MVRLPDSCMRSLLGGHSYSSALGSFLYLLVYCLSFFLGPRWVFSLESDLYSSLEFSSVFSATPSRKISLSRGHIFHLFLAFLPSFALCLFRDSLPYFPVWKVFEYLILTIALLFLRTLRFTSYHFYFFNLI